MSTAVIDKAVQYGEAFRGGADKEAAWSQYVGLREKALRRLLAVGVATRGREAWMHGDAGTLASGGIMPLFGDAGCANMSSVVAAAGVPGAVRFVLTNGVFDPDRSDLTGLPAGVEIFPLSGGGVQKELGTVAQLDVSAFTCLNTAFWRDGLCLRVAAGVVVSQPIEVHLVDDLADGQGIIPTRHLLVLGAGSQVTVIERYGDGATGVTVQPLTEVVCGAGAVLNHIKLVNGDTRGEHFGSTHVRQERDSRYRSWEVLTGNARTRREVHLSLAGVGAACDLNALYLGAGEQRFDLRTRVDHDAVGCQTRELYKGILGGSARGVFDGLITVARDSQQTDAQQTNRNLLLSADAVVNSIPRLEIYADDVKCSHGSTTGQLADEELFYLQTRGFSRGEARVWLALAFASEVIGSLPVAPLKSELAAVVSAALAAADGRA